MLQIRADDICSPIRRDADANAALTRPINECAEQLRVRHIFTPSPRNFVRLDLVTKGVDLQDCHVKVPYNQTCTSEPRHGFVLCYRREGCLRGCSLRHWVGGAVSATSAITCENLRRREAADTTINMVLAGRHRGSAVRAREATTLRPS